MRRLSQRGDTIVEVLIAIAVVASVLAITYSIMNRNLQVMRDNQERTEAVKLAQGQIESLKALWADTSTDGGRADVSAVNANGFCVDLSTDPASVFSLGAGAPHADLGSDNFADYTGPCHVNNIYNIGVRRFGPADNYSYRITVRWNSIVGGDLREASAVYRLD